MQHSWMFTQMNTPLEWLHLAGDGFNIRRTAASLWLSLVDVMEDGLTSAWCFMLKSLHNIELCRLEMCKRTTKMYNRCVNVINRSTVNTAEICKAYS